MSLFERLNAALTEEDNVTVCPVRGAALIILAEFIVLTPWAVLHGQGLREIGTGFAAVVVAVGAALRLKDGWKRSEPGGGG